MNLANFDQLVVSIRPAKFHQNLQNSVEEFENKFSRWPRHDGRCFVFWIKTIIAIFDIHITLQGSTKISSNFTKLFEGKTKINFQNDQNGRQVRFRIGLPLDILDIIHTLMVKNKLN